MVATTPHVILLMTYKPRWSILLCCVCLRLLTGCNTPDAEFDASVYPARIAFQADRLYPEGIAYAPGIDRFLVSSITQGSVGTVDVNGRYAGFVSDSRLISAIGIRVRGNLLYVCNSDQGVSAKSRPQTTLKTAGLLIFDLKTQLPVQAVRLDSLLPGVNHFANDLAFDAAGNAYVTDSFAPVIYRVTPAGKADVFVNNPLFAGTQGFNLNGIVHHPDGFLIVVKSNEGKLFRVSLATPALVNEITGVNLPGGDGLTLLNGDLYVVNGQNRVSQISSTDGWKTATLVGTDAVGYDQATTSTVVNGRLYTLNARIAEVSAAAAANNPALLQADSYSIQGFK